MALGVKTYRFTDYLVCIIKKKVVVTNEDWNHAALLFSVPWLLAVNKCC